jgi:enoyl-[acyl-carrier-protein] reductase (NADH)
MHLKRSSMKKIAILLFFALLNFSCSNNNLTTLTAVCPEAMALTNGSWAQGLTGYIIYNDGGYATTIFTSPIPVRLQLQK